MKTLKSSRKNLRIGVVQNGRLVEDRVIRHGETVTVGSSPANTFVLRTAGAPERFPLLVSRRGACHLHFTADLDGTLQLEDGVSGLEPLRARSQHLADGSFRFPLSDRVRGKVVFGDSTVLFQFVAQPAPRHRLSLARLRQMDTTFSAIVGISAVVHTLFMVHAMAQPLPPKTTVEQVQDRWISLQIPVKPKIEAPLEPSKPVAATPKRARRSAPVDTMPVERPKDEPERPESREARAERLKEIGLLGHLRDRDRGSLLDLVVNGNLPTVDTWASGQTPTGPYVVATTSPQQRLRDGGGPDGGGIGGAGPISERTEVRVAAKERKAPPPVIQEIKVDGGRKTGSLGLAIQRYMGAVAACYDMALKLNPTMAGKYYLELTVEGSGRVSAASVRADRGRTDETFRSCLEARMTTTWRFPASEEGPMDVSVPVVLTPKDSI